MESIIAAAATIMSHHHLTAVAILGVVTFLESLVVVGAFVPATAVMVIAGGFIAAGVLAPLPVLLACVSGAVLGDALSYLLGRRLGARALRDPRFSSYRRKIARTRLYSRRYGVATIYIGRFFGPLRAFVPIIVGMLQMPQRKFQIANVASALIWVPATLAPGYFAARGLAKLEELGEADPLTLCLIVLAAGSVLAVAIWRFVHVRATKRIAKMEARPALLS